MTNGARGQFILLKALPNTLSPAAIRKNCQTRQRSSMPANYDRIYTREELQAIVAYLKSGNL